jgi:hypothetical protein
MYIVLVAPSGAARKGTAMDIGMQFMKYINAKTAAEATTRESLIRELRTASETVIDPQTGEVEMHSSLTIYSQELTVFLGYHNFQLISDLTDWYDCRDRWTYRTKTQGTDDILGVWVNIIGATTPELIQSAMPMEAIGVGLTARMIFVYEQKRRRPVPDPFPTAEELELDLMLKNDLEKISMMQGEFKVTSGFVDLWTDWYLAQDERPPFSDTRFLGYFERRPAHVMKLSMIMSAARSDTMVITETDLQRAIQMLIDTEKKMPQTFSGVGRVGYSEVMAQIMAFIGNKKETTRDEILGVFYRDVDEWTLDKIVSTLEIMHYIIIERSLNKTVIKYCPKDEC